MITFDVPDHVPADKVVDFDVYDLARHGPDLHATLHHVQQSNPDIFWTPHNGGHWVATRADDIEVMQRDYSHFSNARVTVPPAPPEMPLAIPLELDPPRHPMYRRPLAAALLPGVVREMEEDVRNIAVEAIEALRPKGECEFVREFAQVLPIYIFLDLVNLPRSDKDILLPVVNRTLRARSLEERMAGHKIINDYLRGVVTERRAKPGPDLLSQLVNVDIGGERIGEDEALRYASLVLFGGLDTVAAMLSFVARFLAQNPAQRKLIISRIDDDKFLNNAVEELLRRHGLALTSRVIVEDMDYKGIFFRKGDMILPANPFAGLDDRNTDNPLDVDLERKRPKHAVFGNGAHACPGAILARRELKIFLQEWLSRIPEFSLKTGTQGEVEAGSVLGVKQLDLVWPTN